MEQAVGEVCVAHLPHWGAAVVVVHIDAGEACEGSSDVK